MLVVTRAVGSADLAWARTRAFARRVDQARRAIDAAVAHGDIGVSVSGGKDSTVTLDLVRQAVPDAPAAWFDSGAELTGTEALVRAQGADRIAPLADLPTMCRECGWWGATATDPRATYDVVATLIYEPADRFAAAHHLSVMALGLRASESPGRRWSALSRGSLYYCQADERYVVCPVAWWTDADIWAYVASRGLPYHPAYDAMARLGLTRRQWRVGSALGGKAVTTGRVSVIRAIDIALFNQLAAEFPLWAAEAA